MADFKIALIGECMAEISGKPFGTMQHGMGGDSMNTAIYLKKLLPDQGTVSYVSGMGEDSLSQAMIAKWQEFGIDTQFVWLNPEKQVGLYHIHNDDSGERFFQYWRNDSAARYMMQNPNIDDVFTQLAQYDVLFLSGISLAILPAADRLKLIEQLTKAKAKGAAIVFDGNYRPKLWQSTEQAQQVYKAVCQIADLALVTFDDEELLWQDANIAACQQRLSGYGIKEIVIKDGKNGCFYYQDEQEIHIATDEVTNVVDTTAAGDSFNAGFLAGWLNHKSPTACGELGNAVAGQVIQQRGAIVPLDIGIKL